MKYRINLLKASCLIFIIVSVGLQICFSVNSHAQNFVFSKGVKRNALTFIKIKNLIVIPIYINGKGPFNFLLDTGVDPLIITDSTLIDTLQYKRLRPVKIYGVGTKKEIDAFFSIESSVKINDATMNNMPTILLKEDSFNLSGYLGMKIYGLIGFHFFNSFIVRVNYINSKIIFKLPEADKQIKGTKIDLEFLDNKPYINTFLKTQQMGEIPVKLIVDCGASHALSLETYKNKVFPLPKPNISGNLGIGLGGEISGSIGRISGLKLGTFELNNVLTNFPDYEDVASKATQKDRSGNLGSEILKRFHITYDYQNKAMYLRKNDSFNQPFEHDMSGIEIFITDDPTTRYFISRIEAGSPAEKAGLSVNDEITGINFKKIETYTVDEITSALKTTDGQALIIEIMRKDHIVIKVIKLKKRI